MAKSKETFNKKEKEKKRLKQKQEKMEKMQERKANATKGKSLEDMMAYIDENGEGYAPIFGDGSYDDKINKYDEIDERNDDFLNECIRKISYLTSFWFAAKATLSKIDFESMDKLFQENLSTYRVVEDKEEVKVEEKTEQPTA